MKLWPALALLLTPALLPGANVLYSLDGETPQRTVLSFVTKGWLTDLPPAFPGTQTWTFRPSQMIQSPCDSFRRNSCTISIAAGGASLI